ncbi:MAG: hypothetical protein RLZZ373_852 [Pseudomonadota bacterium]
MTQAMLDYTHPRAESDCDRIARMFRQRPGVWISALEFAPICLAWRTRISNLRYAPYSMVIEWRSEQHGRTKRSFYRWAA